MKDKKTYIAYLINPGERDGILDWTSIDEDNKEIAKTIFEESNWNLEGLEISIEEDI